MTTPQETKVGNKTAAKAGGNGADKSGQNGRGPVAISHPRDVAQLVLLHVNAVNAKKDELTIATKGLMDVANQLVRAYAGQTQAIEKLQARVKQLEGGDK
jgi:hypothetical protein